MDARLSASGLTRGQRLAARSILAVLALGVVLLLVTDGDRRPLGPEVLAGIDELRVQLADDPAPSFDLAGTEGIRHRLGDFSGRPLLVHFWASWCPTCLPELPLFQQLQARYGPRGLQQLHVSLDEEPAAAVRVLPRGFQLPVAFDPGGSLAHRFGTEKLPEVYLLDAHGRVRLRFVANQPWLSPPMLRLLDGFMP